MPSKYAHLLEAGVFARNSGATSEALALLLEATVKYPEEWQANYEIGFHYQYEGQLSLARAYYQRAAETARLQYLSTRSFALACAGLGLVDESCSALAQAQVEDIHHIEELGAIADYAFFARDYPQERIVERYRFLASRFSEPEVNGVDLQNLAMDALMERKGFAYVRLGDGEGALMSRIPRLETHYGAVMKFIRAHFCHQFLGVEVHRSVSFLSATRVLFEQLADVDVLAFPALERILFAYRCADMVGATSLVALLEELAESSNLPSRRSWPEVHWELLKNGGLRHLVEAGQGLLVITSRPKAVTYLRSQFPATSIDSILIEPEAQSVNPNDPSFGSPTELFFPNQFEEVLHRLESIDLRGHLVLIGGGPLGKQLVLRAKKSGGVALDLGAIFDTFAGLVRPNVPMDFQL